MSFPLDTYSFNDSTEEAQVPSTQPTPPPTPPLEQTPYREVIESAYHNNYTSDDVYLPNSDQPAGKLPAVQEKIDSCHWNLAFQSTLRTQCLNSGLRKTSAF